MRKENLNPLGLALALIATLTLFVTTTSAECATNYDFCSGSGFPSDFCCPSGTSCVTLASNTTLLCCPAGDPCNGISPIVCSISQQNATLHPQSPIKTTNLTGELSQCGTDLCCPFGFSCAGTGKTALCIKDLNQKLLSPSSSSEASSTSTSTLPADSTSPTDTSTTDSPVNITPTALPATCDRFPVTAIITGLLPGIFAGILLSLITFCLLGARRRRADARAPKISSPTYQGSDFRTDFVRRYQPSSPGTSAATPATGISRVRSLFRKSSSAAAGARQTRGLGMGLPSSPSPRRIVPPMPERDLTEYRQELPAGGQLRREPSSESINIFADPSTARSGGLGVEERRQSAQTTFTEMMERADLRGVGQGEPYVPVMPSRLGAGEETRLGPGRFSPEIGRASPRR